MNDIYTLQKSTLDGLGDAMREHFDTSDTFTPLEMIEKLNEREASEILITLGSDEHIDPITEDWVRPSKWPDIDALAAQIEGDQDCVYFTYDLSIHPDYHWIGMYIEMSEGTEWYLDRYDEGDFVHTHLSNTNQYIRYDLTNEPDDSDVQIWRLTSNGHISRFGFTCNTTVSADNFDNNCQPCVDRAGTLPWCAKVDTGIGTGNHRCGATIWLEHDAMVFGKNVVVTSLEGIWLNARRLKELDTSQWDTSNWAVTSLYQTWGGCYSLRKLELNNLDTSNWAVTNISRAWDACISLQKLNLNNWNTTNWAVTSLAQTWQWCASLHELEINQWDTSNWAVTTLYMTWYQCFSLKELNLNNWDTSNWAVTTLSNTWYSCLNLIRLKINTWDTNNWAVTSLASTWYNCYNLKRLNLNTWDTSNWRPTTLESAWQDCRQLQELNIGQWDTSNWPLSKLNGTWSNCYGLKKLNLNNWNTSNWDLTTLSGTWSGDRSLSELNINQWDTENWAITTLYNTWESCYSLKKLNLNNWNTSNWVVTDLRNTWGDCWNLQELNINNWNTSNWDITAFGNLWRRCYSLKILDISNWDTSGWDNTYNSSDTFTKMYTLEICRLPASLPSAKNLGVPIDCPLLTYYSGYNIQYTHSLSGLPFLTSESLRSILNRLPIITSSLTITLGQANRLKLTAEDIAIATNKGWTVA